MGVLLLALPLEDSGRKTTPNRWAISAPFGRCCFQQDIMETDKKHYELEELLAEMP